MSHCNQQSLARIVPAISLANEAVERCSRFTGTSEVHYSLHFSVSNIFTLQKMLKRGGRNEWEEGVFDGTRMGSNDFLVGGCRCSHYFRVQNGRTESMERMRKKPLVAKRSRTARYSAFWYS